MKNKINNSRVTPGTYNFSNLIRIVKQGFNYPHKNLIGEIEAKPYQQSHLSLGTFSTTTAPTKYAVEVSPNTESDDTIITQVIPLAGQLILHIANYGQHKVIARVWQLLP